MDTSAQLYEVDATDWKRGLYDDIRETFRAPFINWIFRTTMANYPEFLRYAWPQIKPVFETQAFATFSITYRDTVLSSVENGSEPIPVYRRFDTDIAPAEFGELRNQLTTFDVVAPRLALLFEIMDSGLHADPIGQNHATNRAATAPYPDWLDADRGTEPTMTPFDEFPQSVSETADALQRFHGIDEGLPSIYRCLAQWPDYFTRAWDDLEPAFTGGGFDDAVNQANRLVSEHVDEIPSSPQIAPADLRDQGFSEDLIDDVQNLFREFNSGAIESVVPAIHVFAATLDVEGERTLE